MRWNPRSSSRQWLPRFSSWIGSISEALKTKGFTAAQANQLASAFVSGVEGCIVVSRAGGTPQPFVDFAKTIPVLVAGIAAQAA